jgi:VWFA-related protein
MRARAIVAGLSASLAVSVVSGQSPPPQPTPTFKAEVEYVEVDTLVADKDGHFVRNLTKEDFRILEDGKPQKISAFTLVDIPNESAGPAESRVGSVDNDVQSNERPFDGRVYVVVLDDLHTQFSRTPRTQAAARQFIERNVGANDLMAIVSTGARAQDSQAFTNNKQLLLTAVDAVFGQKLDSPSGSRIADSDSIERVDRARMALATLRQVAEWFGGVRGRRKTLLLFSEGIDFDFASTADVRAATVYRDFVDTAAAAARANVSIYAIDPRGLGLVSDDAITLPTLDGRSVWLTPPPTSASTTANPSAPASVTGQLNDELRVSQRNLRSLADETGGAAAMNRNDYSGFFTRIVLDSSSYYLLAYDPPSRQKDDKLRRIEVRVSRPGLTVRARRGYVPRKANATDATPPGMPAALRDALASPLPVTGLSMRVAAAPFMGSASIGSVVLIVEMLGRDLTLGSRSRVEVSFRAVDATGKVQGARNQAIALDLRPETRVRVEETGIRLLNRLELPAGRYQLRVAARDPGKGNVGAVTYDLDVPDFSRQPISLSGLTLASLAGDEMFTPRQDERFESVLPAAPVARREFLPNDELALFGEVYDHSGAAPHEVTLESTVLAADGRVMDQTKDTIESSDFDANRSYQYSLRIPLGDFDPGHYQLRVEARSSTGNAPTASRRIAFIVAAATDRGK